MKQAAPTRSEVEQAVQTLVRFGQLGTRPDPPVITEAAPPPSEGGRIPGREDG